MRRAGPLLRALALAATIGSAALGSPAALARVEVTLDARTLTDFLTSVTPPTLLLPLPSGGDVALELRELKVNGFDPAAGKNGRGQVLTSLRLGIPALGLSFPVEPRLSLDVETEGGVKVCVLRFDRLPIPLPMTGSLDVGPLLPSFRVPAEAEWSLPMKQGDVSVRSRLVDTRMGAESLRLGFDLEMAPDRVVRQKGK